MIQPSIGTSEYKLGVDFSELGLPASIFKEIEDRGVLKVFKLEKIWFFVNKDNNKLDQLSLFQGFDEKVLGKVGLGDNLQCLKSLLGECTNIDGVYEPNEYPGISFELDKNKTINCISVSLPYQFHGELPSHIKRNLPGQKRKLP